MVGPQVTLVVIFVMFAGCAGSPAPKDAPIQAPLTTTQLTEAPKPVELTDTFHFLTEPHLTGHTPKSTTATRIALPDEANRMSAPAWSFETPLALPELPLNFTLWVDVQGSVAHYTGLAPETCFWEVTITVKADMEPTSTGCAGDEPQVVPNGVRKLEFSSGVYWPAGELPAGVRISIALSTNAAVVAPGATMELLTASVEHDSRFSGVGLQFPVDTLTLLSS